MVRCTRSEDWLFYYFNGCHVSHHIKASTKRNGFHKKECTGSMIRTMIVSSAFNFSSPDHGRRKKINLNFYTSSWCIKGFVKALKANKVNFFKKNFLKCKGWEALNSTRTYPLGMHSNKYFHHFPPLLSTGIFCYQKW